MITIILGLILIFLFGIYSGIRVNKWSNRINDEIQKKKTILFANNTYKNILENIKNKKAKFRSRINNTVYLKTNLPDLGKVEIIYLMDKEDIVLFQGNKCILTSDNVDVRTLTEISSTINQVYHKKINDVVDIMGMVFSKEDFEKMFKINLEEIKKQSGELMNEVSDLDNIIQENSNRFDMDEILDKINRVGIDNLTPEEKKFLDNYNK